MRLESLLDVFDSQRRVSQQVELGPPSYRKKKKVSEINLHFSGC